VEIPKLHLKHLRTATFDTWRAENFDPSRELHVVVSGYETRGTAWARKTNAVRDGAQVIVFGFLEMQDSLQRPANDAFYRDCGLEVKNFSRDDADGVLEQVGSAVEILKRDNAPLRVHVDYSCMPRRWYCSLPLAIEKFLRPQDRAYFWYSPGNYSIGEYPTAGVSDFHVFAGRASLSARFRTHVFGLGFDRIRANAICSVLDPQYLVCFYADPGVKEDYVRKVQMDNRDILSQANLSFTLPINDFNASFTRLFAIASDFQQFGDVVFVPDGPKPLILASSLVPLVFGKAGTLCFHVARRKTKDHQPIDVVPTGDIYGFVYSGFE
jgi:hypothetical protein